MMLRALLIVFLVVFVLPSVVAIVLYRWSVFSHSEYWSRSCSLQAWG